MSLRDYKLLKKIFLGLSNLAFIPGHRWRPLLSKWGGVNIIDYKTTFIGRGVCFDSVYPELITIESGVRVTANSIILTHYYNPSTGHYDKGRVIIKENAFLGAGTIITKPISIGVNSVVGAGSIVTKNIPDNEVWVGNPAHFIKRIEHI